MLLKNPEAKDKDVIRHRHRRLNNRRRNQQRKSHHHYRRRHRFKIEQEHLVVGSVKKMKKVNHGIRGMLTIVPIAIRTSQKKYKKRRRSRMQMASLV